MNPQQDPLAGLHDIILPESVGLWPLAPGWWLLLVLVVVAVSLLMHFTRQHRKATNYRRQAKRELDLWLNAEQPESPASNEDWSFFNQWCKRTLFYCNPRVNLSALSGKSWQQFLRQQTHPLPEGVIKQLGNRLYDHRSNASNIMVRSELHRIGLLWLKKLPSIKKAQISKQSSILNLKKHTTDVSARKEPSH